MNKHLNIVHRFNFAGAILLVDLCDARVGFGIGAGEVFYWVGDGIGAGVLFCWVDLVCHYRYLCLLV